MRPRTVVLCLRALAMARDTRRRRLMMELVAVGALELGLSLTRVAVVAPRLRVLALAREVPVAQGVLGIDQRIHTEQAVLIEMADGNERHIAMQFRCIQIGKYNIRRCITQQ